MCHCHSHGKSSSRTWTPFSKIVFEKARWVLRVDKKIAFFDFYHDYINATVAAHESLLILIAFVKANDLVFEGADIPSCYLFCKLDIPVFMELLIDSIGIEDKPGYVCRLVRSIYGAVQAGEYGNLYWATKSSLGTSSLRTLRHAYNSRSDAKSSS